jgi:hypothetical protein
MDRYEARVDRAIREAQERGEFDNLPGAGRPLPGAGQPYDENWWVKELVRRENLTGVLSPGVALRRESEDLHTTIAGMASEHAVRAFVEDLNARIREARRFASRGPMLLVRTHDVDKVVAAWRRTRGPAGDD